MQYLLVFIVETTPRVLYVVDVEAGRVHSALVLLSAFRDAVWQPRGSDLAAPTGNGNGNAAAAASENTLWFLTGQGDLVYRWTPAGATAFQIPFGGFSVRHLEFNRAESRAMLIKDKSSFCIGYSEV